MTWNISSECISVVMLCIIWVYSRRGNPLPTLKNRLFQICFLTTFLAMTSNICSTIMIYYYLEIPLLFTWAVTMVYFIATPLMGVIYFFYAVSILYENRKGAKNVILWSAGPAILYMAAVLTNPFTKAIFDISAVSGYSQGPLIVITYLIFYFYCFACVILTWVQWKKTENAVKRILLSFPIIAVVVIVFQQFFPDYILSGSAATCALLLIYLYLQNKQISIDYLTGIPNRQEFLKMIDLKLRERKSDHFIVIVLSLKGFKLINDKFGQQNGDLLLQRVSEWLRENVKPCLLYRFSGDEFAILIENTYRDKIDAIVSAIISRLHLPWMIGDCSCSLSGALGIVQYPDSADSKEGLINGIEYAVAQAKADKVHKYSYCTPDMLEKIHRRNQIVEILKDKLAQNSFELYYQPILSVKNQTFTFAEALLRMNDTPLGPIYPSEFIPIAEDTGLIVEITYQILDQCCGFIRKLMDQGVDIEGVSINFSYVQFLQEDLIQRVCDIISQSNVPYSKIKIEITESVLANNPDVINSFIDSMHKLGILFGLDDFGTGYSNVSSVFQISIDTIKLDKSLVWNTIGKPNFSTAIRQLILMFQKLDMKVLAEGVETEEQSQFVVECGCDMIQGFLYAKPMPADQAEHFLGRKLCQISQDTLPLNTY